MSMGNNFYSYVVYIEGSLTGASVRGYLQEHHQLASGYITEGNVYPSPSNY